VARARTIKALEVAVTAERLDKGREAYSVRIVAHPKVPNQWAADMLRQIADGLERDPLVMESGVSG
jgi:hypothetical protein